VQGKVRVELTAKGSGKIVKVEARATGQVIGTKEQEPFVLEWDTSQLAGGNHVLELTVTDSVGNRASKTVNVRVGAAPTPTRATPTPVATPTPRPSDSGNGNNGLMLGLLGVAWFAALGLLVARRRRIATTHVVPMHKVVSPTVCPTCGRALKKREACPVCTAEDDKVVSQRVRELGDPPSDDEQQEERP
jgi:hypothetical protein